jgi:hypothetical protein
MSCQYVEGEGEGEGVGATSVWCLKLLRATSVWVLKLLSASIWCREELAPGVWTFTARDYLDVFKDKGISCVVRSLLA